MTELIGRNLKKARESAGLSQEELAELLGVSRATLSAIENGHIAIDSTKLLAASRVLGRPVSEFFANEEGTVALLYRGLAEATAPVPARSAFEQFSRAYRELEEIVGVADSQLLPPDYSASQAAESRPDSFAVQVAASERQRLGLNDREPVTNIFQLFEEQGVRILRSPMEHAEVFGVSAFSPKYGPCILVNEANTIERQIFTLAHEYGHLLMHRRYYQSSAPSASLDKEHPMELMANEFAGHFLVPTAGLREVFVRDIGEKKVGLEDLVFLKRYFKVSALMVVRRLRDSGLTSKAEADDLNGQLEKRVPLEQELVPLSDDVVREWAAVSRFNHLARKAALEGMVSLGKLAELMSRNVVETRKQVQEWRQEVALA